MRILQVTPRYLPSSGGIEVVVHKISSELLKKGFEVIVYSVDRTSDLPAVENINGVVVKRFTALFGDPLFLPEPKFIQELRSEKADIIHVHNIHTLLPLVVALSKGGRQKMLLQPHYHRYGQSLLRNSFFDLYKQSYKKIFSQTDVILANSVYEKKALEEDFPFVRNLLLLPEGIDVEEVKIVKRKPVEPKLVLYVGTLRSYKNVDKVLEGFANLVEHHNCDFRLVIVGSGPERDSLISLATSLRINELVEWQAGLSRQQLLDEYSKASVLIMLSPLESFSRVVYDALIMGLPVVVLNSGAFSNLVSSGFVEGINSTNSKSVAHALEKATQKSYPRISFDNGAFLDWKNYVNKISAIYECL